MVNSLYLHHHSPQIPPQIAYPIQVSNALVFPINTHAPHASTPSLTHSLIISSPRLSNCTQLTLQLFFSIVSMVALASSSSLLSSPCAFLGQKLAFDNANANAAVPLPQVASVRFRTPSISASYTTSERTRPLYSSSSMASSASLYEVLGLSTGATLPEIKSAYRKLARVCHPDVVAIDRKDSSANEFKKIYAAYSTLSDPEKRAEYDRNLFVGQRIYRSPPYSASSYASASSSMSGFSGPSRRTWETDQCW